MNSNRGEQDAEGVYVGVNTMQQACYGVVRRRWHHVRIIRGSPRCSSWQTRQMRAHRLFDGVAGQRQRELKDEINPDGKL